MAFPWQTPGIFGPLSGGGGGLFGGQQVPAGGVLGEPQMQVNPAQDARMAFAAQMLAGSGYSPQRRGFGEIFGSALMAGQQARQAAQQQIMQQREMKAQEEFRKAQMDAMNRPEPPKTPQSVAEYEYARQNGFQGSFQDWLSSGGAPQGETADIQNWKFYQSLSPEQQKQWMSLQRQPTAPQLAVINGVPTLVDRIQGTQTPLTTQQAEIQAVADRAAAEAEARGMGTARGEAQGGLEKKGIAALSTNDTLDLAIPLIDSATGSVAGAAADKLSSVFGYAPKGAQATAELKILQANLMTNMPRMEGPQSDRDVQLYREAAGQIGDPSVPRELKKAAIRTIRRLNQKYIDRAGIGQGGSAGSVRRFNPETGRIE